MRHQGFLRRSFPLLVSIAFLFTGLTSAVAQSPLLYNRSIFNAASYMPGGIPASAIAQGSVFTVFGANLGPGKPATANSFPLGTTLANVSMTVVQGTTTVNAIPVYVSGSQINAIMPSNAPLGAASLRVFFNNAPSNYLPVRITNTAFGIFTALGTGLGPGILQNFVAATDQPINAPKITAKPGQTITLWGTGLGPVPYPDTQAPKAGNLPVQVQVFVGGVPATVQYSGRSPCCSGTDQIVFQVPANAPQGCWVPVYVKTAGSVVSNFVTMAIQSSGGTCEDAIFPDLSSVMVNGGNFFAAILFRQTTHEDVGVVAPIDVTGDYHFEAAFNVLPITFPFDSTVSMPPRGTCTVYTEQADLMHGAVLPGLLSTASPLSIGPPFSLTGPKGPVTLDYPASGYRADLLGGLISNNVLPGTLYLNPGSYTMTSTGGTDAGPFSATFSIPQPLTWTNRDQITLVDRTQPLTISWTGADAGAEIAVVGVGEDLPTNSSAVFKCIAAQGASSLTVPPDLLANLPATNPNDPLKSKDVIYLVDLAGTSRVHLNLKGFNHSSTGYLYISGKTVVLQ
ncbi:MAG TPA: IPT/TIG domain-containing protein [Bryobacteraceae bacterium]|nr:IPT/TIG domain-containing protein [Bryobacteraceae bacterium]